MKFAKLGDTIVCDLITQPKRLAARLTTPEALAFGNELIASGRWRLDESYGNPMIDPLERWQIAALNIVEERKRESRNE